MKQSGKAFYIALVLLIEIFVILAFVYPALAIDMSDYYGYSYVLGYSLMDIAGGTAVSASTSSATVSANALPGLLVLLCLSVAPVLLVAKKDTVPFYLGLGLSLGAIALAFYFRSEVSDIVDYLEQNGSTRYDYEEGFGHTSLLVYAVLLIVMILIRLLDMFLTPALRASLAQGGIEGKLKEAEKLKEGGLISEEEYRELRDKILKGK